MGLNYIHISYRSEPPYYVIKYNRTQTHEEGIAIVPLLSLSVDHQLADSGLLGDKKPTSDG